MEKIIECPVCGSNLLTDHFSTKDYFLTQENFSLSLCKECGFVLTNPRPSAEELPKYYNSENYLSHHAKGFSPTRWVYQFLRQINIHHKYSLVKSFIRQGSLLDVGCGTGELLNYFRKKGWEVQGVEPNPQARLFGKQSYNLSVEDERMLQSYPPSSFDVISLWHVLEHVPDLNQRIVDLKKLLKPNGLLFIALPNLTSPDAQYYGSIWAGLDVPRHLYHFTPNTVLRLASQHSLSLIKSFPMKMDAYYVSLLSEQYKGSCCAFLRASIRGKLSNSQARKSNQYSSMIYVLRK